MISERDYESCACGHERAEHETTPDDRVGEGQCGHFSRNDDGVMAPCACEAFEAVPRHGEEPR